MKFCENCNYLIDGDEVCPICGKTKDVREVTDDDFCFFVELSDFHFEMLEYTLKENAIDVVGMPYYPSGVHNGNAGRARGRYVFVRYKDLETAREIYNIIFGLDEDDENGDGDGDGE